MSYFLIGLIVSASFLTEARKRGQKPILWFSAGFTAYYLPHIVVFGLFNNQVQELIKQYPESSKDILLYVFVVVLSLSIAFSFWAYKELIKYKTSDEGKEKIQIKSLEIAETENGEYSVGQKMFKTKSDAENYVSFLKGMSH